MAIDLYQSIMTKNSELAKFFDENHAAALMVKKVVTMVDRIAREDHFDSSKATFEVYSPKGSDVIVVRIKKSKS